MPIDLRRRGGDAAGLSVPDLSVIVPTHGRPDAIVRLLRALARQTLPARRFEVLVTDDGSRPSVVPVVRELSVPYALACEWQPQGGPGAARNRAIAKARGRVLLILNDDAGPCDDLLAKHLAAHGDGAPRAWLGDFPYAPEADSALARACTRLALVFPFAALQRDAPNGGNFFWTCNVSVPRRSVLDAGGFDESFRDPICEDVELGLRLAAHGVGVWYLQNAPCLHHHLLDTEAFVRRQIDLGRGMVRLWRKHRDPALLPGMARAQGDEAALAAALERELVARAIGFEPLAAEIAALDRLPGATPPSVMAEAAVKIEQRVGWLSQTAIWLGCYAGLRELEKEKGAARRWLASRVAPSQEPVAST
ncbi:MAG TPA: glycosyltransferase [Planctomycetota bacterium]|jgi:GT2 family glycosyltransferase|nr:glycosyltransferase [Planctomycetota bacterium]